MNWSMSYIIDAGGYAPLQRGTLTNIRITNTSGELMLATEVLLKFDWMGTYRFVQRCNIKIKTSETATLPDVPFTIDLGAPLGSRNFKPGIIYKLLEENQWVSYEDSYVSRGDFIEIQPLPSKDYKVFVSHSNNPSDTRLVKACKEAMKTCGLMGYFAEEHTKPGFKLWDKIARDIISSDALLVLWTESAANSGDVREEIGIAIGSNKLDRIVPVVENGVEVAGSLKLRGIEWVDYEHPNYIQALSKALETIMEWAKEKEMKKARIERTRTLRKTKLIKTGVSQ